MSTIDLDLQFPRWMKEQTIRLTTEISNYRLSLDDERMCKGIEAERSGCYLIQLCIIREIVTLTFENDLNHKPADVLSALQRIAIAWENKNLCLYLERMGKQLLTTLVMQWLIFHHCQTNRTILLRFDSGNRWRRNTLAIVCVISSKKKPYEYERAFNPIEQKN